MTNIIEKQEPILNIDMLGNQFYTLNGRPHREDGPAEIHTNGLIKWYRNGLLHRDGEEPAIIGSDGSKCWIKNGLKHREDGPAEIDADGSYSWYKNGSLHNPNGEPAISSSKRKVWAVDGNYHRKDAPAITYADGSEEWWLRGKKHRLDGPAVTKSNGEKEYWIKSIQYSEKEFNSIFLAKKLTKELKNNSKPISKKIKI